MEHSLFAAFKRLKGNARGCVLTEPLWGIPYNLYAPYVSVYMVALGLIDTQIGLIATIGQVLQVLMALFSGVITDKLGRRRTTYIFDILSWVVPSLISAFAQNFWYFLVAVIINSTWRIVHNSWHCLLVEDTEEEQLLDIYAWIYIAGQLVAFFSLIASMFIKRFGLISTMRGLYIFAAIMFTIKATITFLLTKETEQGKIRQQETKGQSIFIALVEMKGVFVELLHSPHTLITAGIMVIISATGLISSNFWPILVTARLNIPTENLAIFQILKSVFMLPIYFFVLPRFKRISFKLPMVFSFVGLIASQFLLVAAPLEGYSILVLSLLLEATCFAMVSPLVDRMLVVTVEAKERARIQSLIYVAVILLTSPFGWIAGQLSSQNKIFPFMLNIALYIIGAVLVGFAARAAAHTKKAAQVGDAG